MGKNMFKGCESFKPGGKETSATCFLTLQECGLNLVLFLIGNPLYLKT